MFGLMSFEIMIAEVSMVGLSKQCCVLCHDVVSVGSGDSESADGREK